MIIDRSIKEYQKLSVQLKASFWALACGVLQRGIQVIVTPVFTRIMTTTEYGQYTAFTSWLEILGILLTLRLYYGVFTQGLVRYDNDKDEYTSSLIGLMTTIEIIGLLIYYPFSKFWNGLTQLTTLQTLCIFAISWASGLFEFWSARQRVAYRYRALAVVTVMFALAQPILGVAAVLMFPDARVDGRVGSMALVQMTFFTWIFFLYLKRGKRLFSRGHWAHALKFNIPLVPHYLSMSFLNQADRIMIARMVSIGSAGIYGLAYSLSFIMTILNQALLNTLNPWIYEQIKQRNYGDLAHVSYIALAAISIANLFVVTLAPEAIALFAPNEYQEGVWLVPPLAASVVVTFMYSLFADFEFYYERTDLVTLASLAGALLNIILNFVLIPLFGYQAAAWTTLLGYSLYVAMHYAFMRKVQRSEMEGVRVYDPIVMLSVPLTFMLASAVVCMLYPYPPIRYAIFIFGGLVAVKNREKIADIWKRVRNR